MLHARSLRRLSLFFVEVDCHGEAAPECRVSNSRHVGRASYEGLPLVAGMLADVACCWSFAAGSFEGSQFESITSLEVDDSMPDYYVLVSLVGSDRVSCVESDLEVDDDRDFRCYGEKMRFEDEVQILLSLST